MAEQVILNLPDRLAKQVHEVAALTQRKLEDILIEWLDRGSLDEIAIGDLSDEQILKLCDLQMSEIEQTQMSLLLEKQRKGMLQQIESEQLDGLLQVYRRGMVRKAEALKVAVEKGLQVRLGQWDGLTFQLNSIAYFDTAQHQSLAPKVIDESEKLLKSAESFAAVDGDVALLIEGWGESIEGFWQLLVSFATNTIKLKLS